MTLSAIAVVVALALPAAWQTPSTTSDLRGRVLFSGLPVPGATVSVTHGDRAASTRTGDDGGFHFAALDAGVWTVRIESRGFVSVTRSVTLPLAESLSVPMTMLTYEEIVASLPAATTEAEPDLAEDLRDLPAAGGTGAGVINGSMNNGAATPFAQPRAFGNNRPRLGQRYTGSASVAFGDSALNARPFSFSDTSAPAPSYADAQLEFVLGGPVKIPWLVKNGPRFVLAYQHGLAHTATTASAPMPTPAERAGDFSASPIVIRDPVTGAPFAGNTIPSGRISPEAADLLRYFPLPNATTSRGANYQAATLTKTTTDHLQFAVTKLVTSRTTIGGTFTFTHTDADASSLFGFDDATRQSSIDGALDWSRRLSTTSSLRLRYGFTGSRTIVRPFLAAAGPPALSFPDIASLTDADPQRLSSRAHTAGGALQLRRGRHEITLGGDAHLERDSVLAQADPRGTLGFTGAASGDDFADFLLGLPSTSTIGVGNGTMRLHGRTYDAYATDDWRFSGLALTLGARWEYETPFTGPSAQFDRALRSDRRGIEPRLGVSWRPFAASSFVIRGSYGIYRNLGLYLPLATLESEQPPFSRTFSVQSGPAAPLTLADPFPASVPSAATFVVDPGYVTAYAQNWQITVQRDLPASLTAIASYLGIDGSRLPQASLPNTYPAGAVNPCPECPSGFILLTSHGDSIRNALQLTLRRRLHTGFTASAQYTLSKATDDAATFSNTTISPRTLSIAQDWQDLDAERGPSSFDQRHVLSAQAQYTSGVGVAGGTLVDNVWGTIFKDWTLTSQMNAASGLPFSPVFFTAVAGTGFVGVRPSIVSTDPVTFGAPLPGEWGDAGRNSLRGPSQFSLDGSVARVFRLRGRTSLECRVAATNVLNHVTFSTIGTIVGSPQFDLPTVANPMRRLQVTARFRF